VTSVADKIGKIRAIFRPKAMVVGNKNRKIEIFFNSLSSKDLHWICRLQFCRFSHQTRRLVQ